MCFLKGILFRVDGFVDQDNRNDVERNGLVRKMKITREMNNI